MPGKPERNVVQLPLGKIANGDFRGEGTTLATGWLTREPHNDSRNVPTGLHTYQDIPLEVVNPVENNGKACLLLLLPFGRHRRQ